MLFDFDKFIQTLREHSEKKEIIEKYEKVVWPIVWDIKDQVWYKEYVSKFEVVDYKVPEEIKNDFDWKLLMQLVAASFSSEWDLERNEDDLPDLVISVQSWDQVVVKRVSELWWFQVDRLFEIYIEEQINLEILRYENEKEKEIIDSQRESRLERWKLVLDNLNKKKIEAEEEKKKKEELDDLMKQL